MLIIGERINATRKDIGAAITARNAAVIREEALKQVEAGAQMLDLNGGLAGTEVESLSWLVDIVQETVEVPLCLDSSDPEALRRALPRCRQAPMINSVTADTERIHALLPLVRSCGAKVVALCLSSSAPPADSKGRVELAAALIGRLTAEGVPQQDIYVDPCVFPIGTDAGNGPAVLEAVVGIRGLYPEIHISCGVSNISYGLPARRLLNEVFLLMLIGCGLDTAILDPCSPGLAARITAAEMLSGRDVYCRNYLRAYRDGKLAPPAQKP